MKTKIRFVVIDKASGEGVSKRYMFENEAKESIPQMEEYDKECGCYIKDSYEVIKVETI